MTKANNVIFGKMEGSNADGGKEAFIYAATGAHMGYLTSQTAREYGGGMYGPVFVECYSVEIFAGADVKDWLQRTFWVKDFKNARAALKAARDWAKKEAPRAL